MEILCFGDSNTYGLGGFSLDFRYPRDLVWPALLGKELGAKVKNRGENGRQIPHTQKDLDEICRFLRANPKTDLLIIMLGTNDALAGLSPWEIQSRMDAFLTAIRPVAPLLLLIVPPDGALYAKNLQTVSEKHKTLFADASQWNLPLQPDGVHLTLEAHRQFATLLSFKKESRQRKL